MVLACRPLRIYSRSRSTGTSNDVPREDFYICGMTVADPLRNNTPAISYDGLLQTEASGTIPTNWLAVPDARCHRGEEPMTSRETPLASEAPRGVHAQSACERAMKVAAMLLLTATFILAGTSTATAAPASTGNYVASAFDPPPPCRGDKPGVCPSSPFAQLSTEPATETNEEPATER